MTGLDFLGSAVGLDATDIAKMFGGVLSGTGGVLASRDSAKGDKASAEKLKQMEEDKRKAEKMASTMRTALVAGGATVAGALGLYWLKVRK